jgi:hypothetical protein
MSTTHQSLKRLKTGRFVTNHHVNTLRRNYEAKRWVENSKRIGKQDSLGVWYGLDDLRCFLDTAEKSGADAVCLYFGVYPSSFPGETWRENTQTVVFVAGKQTIAANGVTVPTDIYVPGPNGPQLIAFNISGPLAPPRPDENTIFENIPLFKTKQETAL